MGAPLGGVGLRCPFKEGAQGSLHKPPKSSSGGGSVTFDREKKKKEEKEKKRRRIISVSNLYVVVSVIQKEIHGSVESEKR